MTDKETIRTSKFLSLVLATDYCVKLTALDAAQMGFETHLIEDATRGVKPDSHAADNEERSADLAHDWLKQSTHLMSSRVRSGN